MTWCSGNTTDFDSVIHGSNPCVTSKLKMKMKKITLIVVSLLATLFSYSQDFNRVVQMTKSEYRDDKWVTVDTQSPTDMFVITKDWDISIGKFKIKTYDEPEKTTYEEHVTYSWKAIDQEGDKCIFMIKKFRPEISTHQIYSVLYSQFLLLYEYEVEN